MKTKTIKGIPDKLTKDQENVWTLDLLHHRRKTRFSTTRFYKKPKIKKIPKKISKAD